MIEIIEKLNEAHKLLAGSSLGKSEYNPISSLLAESKEMIANHSCDCEGIHNLIKQE